MSIYNNIYTLNKIQWKVDNYTTVILKLLSTVSIIRTIPRKDQFSNFVPKTD